MFSTAVCVFFLIKLRWPKNDEVSKNKSNIKSNYTTTTTSTNNNNNINDNNIDVK